MKTFNTPSWVKILSTLALSLLLVATATSCGGKKKGMLPFWAIGLMGDSGTAASSTGNTKPSTDSNGVTLPPSNGADSSVQTVQEVPTKGPATVSGKISPENCFDGNGNSISCSADTGLDLSQIVVQLVDSNGNIIATTNADSNGNYSFNIPELNNGNYRVLINTGNGLNYDYEDFNFTFDPTVNGSNQVAINDLNPSRLYLTSGPANISGSLKTPGFTDQNGNNLVPAGGLAGVTVQLKDSNGNVIATTTTDASGNYSFNISNLPNGNYTVVALGSAVTSNGQPFTDMQAGFQFKFLGNNPSTPTNVTLADISSSWNPATSAVANLTNWSLLNVAVAGTDLSGFTIKLKDASGNVIATTTSNSSGQFSFSQSLAAGVYSIEVSKDGFLTRTSSFSFTPNADGSATSVAQSGGPLAMVPRPSNITGTVAGPSNSPPRIDGAVINFRPDSTQPPSQLVYLLQDDNLRNLIQLWISQACPSCVSACAPSFSYSCVAANQGAGPWTYTTWANKMYSVANDNVTVYFTAVAGKWRYYVSAPGYQNSSENTITLNGQDFNSPPIILNPSTHRTRISGQTVVIDTLSNGSKNSYGGTVSGYTNQGYGISGLFVAMLGNTTTSGDPVVHITLTNNGAYNFDGNSKVVIPPALSTLCNIPSLVSSVVPGQTSLSGAACNANADQLRIAFAINQYSTAKLLSDTTNGVTADNPNASVCHGATCAGAAANNGYQFRGSSYNIFVVDPLKHMSPSSTQADNTGITHGGMLTVVNTVAHLPRRTVQGTVTDAISTGVVSGATVEIGIDTDNDPNTITFGHVRRDQATIPNTSRLAPNHDEQVPAVTTDSNGNYSITNLDPGNYVIRISRPGYVTQLIPITVPSTGPATVVNGQIVQDGPRGNISGRVILAGGASFTGTYTLEILHPTANTRPTAPVNPSSLTSGVTTFTNAPNYSIFQVNPGQWRIRFASAGYVSVEGIVTVPSGGTVNFDIVTFIPGSQAPAPISGRLINAFNNTPITTGLTLILRPGINNTSGSAALDGNNQPIPPITSAPDGTYVIPNVPAGNYTVEVRGTGYVTTYQTVISAGSNSANQNIMVSPALGSDEVRIVLAWGATPKDLDSHLEYGDAACRDGGFHCQVVWNQKTKIGGHLTLDVDDVDGFGPETVTVKGTTWTKPRRGYSVFNYNTVNMPSNPGSISTSGATVKVFKSTGLVRTYNAGPSQVNAWWQIFCLDANKNLIDVGQPGCSASDFFNRHTN